MASVERVSELALQNGGPDGEGFEIIRLSLAEFRSRFDSDSLLQGQDRSEYIGAVFFLDLNKRTLANLDSALPGVIKNPKIFFVFTVLLLATQAGISYAIAFA